MVLFGQITANNRENNSVCVCVCEAMCIIWKLIRPLELSLSSSISILLLRPYLQTFFAHFGRLKNYFDLLPIFMGKKMNKKLLFYRVYDVLDKSAHIHIGLFAVCVIPYMKHSMYVVSNLCAHNPEWIVLWLEWRRKKNERQTWNTVKYDKWICWIVLLFLISNIMSLGLCVCEKKFCVDSNIWWKLKV